MVLLSSSDDLLFQHFGNESNNNNNNSFEVLSESSENYHYCQQGLLTLSIEEDNNHDFDDSYIGVLGWKISIQPEDQINDDITDLYRNKLDNQSSNKIEQPQLHERFIDPKPKTFQEASDILCQYFTHSLDEKVNELCLKHEFEVIEDYSKELFKRKKNGRGKAVNEKYNQTSGYKYKKLNRYPDICPYDYNAFELNEAEHSYINASNIVVNDCNYISCSAPLPHTCNDFWKMVFDSGANTIAMLTSFLEKRKVKAHCYWPGKVKAAATFGRITVSLESQTAIDDVEGLTKRVFIVTSGSKERIVTHWHYTEWSDNKGTFEESLSKIIRYINENNIVGPLITHCSAGVGRAGTFITIHSLLNDLLNGKTTLCMAERVLNLRNQRKYMVQGEEQYYTIVKTLYNLYSNL